jgi:coenzyme PQQ precursor peptide PqqA
MRQHLRRTFRSLAPALLSTRAGSSLSRGVHTRQLSQLRCNQAWEREMAWKTPKIVEVPVGMEINMYACAARK